MSGPQLTITSGPNGTGRTAEPQVQFGVPRPQVATSEWFARASRYAVEAVGVAEHAQRQKIERRLDKPSRRWTSVEVVRTYPANADGERRFREEADVFAAHRYVGWRETGLAGQPFGARLLVGTGLGAFARRDRLHRTAKRTLIWVLQTSLASPAGPAKAIRAGAGRPTRLAFT